MIKATCLAPPTSTPPSFGSGCKLALSVGFMAIATTTASAEFKVSPSAPTEIPYSLACGTLSLSSPERDDDPIMAIYVNPAFKDVSGREKRGPLDGLTITHVSVFGRKFQRADQYTNDYLAQTPGQLEIIWRGSLKKNTTRKMVGRLWNESGSNRWFYSETITEGGRINMKMLAGCHVNEGD